METFVYPTATELEEIEKDLLPRLEEGRVGLQLLPIEESENYRLVWEQEDNYRGLQQVRGLNGQPQSVKPLGGKQFESKPGIYGEFMDLDEEEITLRRAYGDSSKPIDISDLVTTRQEQLLVRRLDRIEWIVWTLLQSGTFAVANAQGTILHTDTFPILTYTAPTPWGTSATATPLNNFRSIQLFGRGQSAQFDGSATAYMNRVTLNRMLANMNPNDLAGRRTSGLNSVLTQDEINKVLMGEGLPNIVVYDWGYLDETGTFVPFIADGKVIVTGKRPGNKPLGKYRMTRNAQKPGAAPGAYTYFVDTTGKDVPAKRQVHDGHNGGPVLFYAGGFLAMNV